MSHHLIGLRADVAFDERSGGRVEADLTRDEQQVARANGGTVGTDRLRRVRRGNRLPRARAAYASLRPARHLCRLGDLAGAQATGADPDAPRRAADQRLHRLQVRLEPPRSHVMRVGDRPAYDRAFPADFTPFSHEFSSRANSESYWMLRE